MYLFGVFQYLPPFSKSCQKVPGTFWQLFLFPPAGAFGWPDIQVEEVFLLVKSDAGKIYILTEKYRGLKI